MDFRELARKRRSNDHFDPTRQISDHQLEELFEFVALSPSGYDLQPWEFVVVRDPANKARLRACAFNQPKVTDASAMVIVCGSKDPARHAERVFADSVAKGYYTPETGKKSVERVTKWRERSEEENRVWAVRSSALSAMSLLYAACDMGLASCPMEGFEADKVRKEFAIPEGFEVVMLVALGYEAKPNRERRMRRPYSEIVHHEKFRA
jgi:nitroreductase